MNVGIFWFHQDQIIANKTQVSSIQPDELGLVDSLFKHIIEWEDKHIYLSQFKLLIGSKYQNFARGRVTYSQKEEKFRVFMDRSLFNEGCKSKIVAFFELQAQQVVWSKDPHYRVYS